MTVTKDDILKMMEGVRDIPSQPDTIIVSPFFYDTIQAEIGVKDAFEGRNWRRIKRERRKARLKVRAKHRGLEAMRGAVYFADSSKLFWRSSGSMRIDPQS